MAKGMKTGGRNFPPGVPGYINKLTEEERQLKKISKDFAKVVLARNAFITYQQLKDKLKEKDNIPCLELLVMRNMESAIATADITKLNWMYITLFGKPRERYFEEKKVTITITDQNGNEIPHSKLENLDTGSLKQIVDGMLREDESPKS